MIGHARLAAVVAGTLVGLACRAGAFVCESDDECLGEAGAGWCEVSGYCGFADDGCESGRRYGSHAPAGLAGDCVPQESGSDEDSTSTSGAGMTSLEGDGLEASDGSSDPSTSSTSTSGEDDGSETSDGGASSSESGEPPPPACETIVVDDFEDGVYEAWGEFVNGDCNPPREEDGRVVLSLPATTDSWCAINREIGTLRNTTVTLEWRFDAAHAFSNSWFHAVGPNKFEFAAGSSELEIRLEEDGPQEVLTDLPFDAEAQRFVRVRGTDDEVFWEISANGTDWSTVHSILHDDLDGPYWLGFGTGAGPMIDGTELWVEQASLCR